MSTVFPNVWGQGALFAFSGLDGENRWTDDFAGYLSGDRVGVLFHTYPTMELYFALRQVNDIKPRAVTSDYICLELRTIPGQTGLLQFAFAGQHLVVGTAMDAALPCVCANTNALPAAIGNAMVYGDGPDYCALATRVTGTDIAFAFAHADKPEKAAREAEDGLLLDQTTLFAVKHAFYESLPVLDAPEDRQRLFLKCCSIMKSQFYTAEGPFSGLWTTPDRLPHRNLWLWDSVFHSLGNRHISSALSLASLRAVIDSMQPDGFIPHMTTPVMHSAITQPPILAWGFLQYHQATGDVDALRAAYDSLKKYLLWNRAHRDSNGNFLYEWALTDEVHCRCDECGMDNSPRFDSAQPMDAIDFSCYMANDVRSMVSIARLIGREDDVAMWQSWYDAIKQAVNDRLWDAQDQMYYDRLVSDGSFYKVRAVSGFLPLFAGIADEKQAQALVAALTDPARFGTPFGIPSISADDKTFGTDMWRGPVWINFNYMIAAGLRDYGYTELAKTIIDRTIEVMGFWYAQEGVFYEFYDCTNRRSPSTLFRKTEVIRPYQFDVRISSIRDYGWSATLLADMLAARYTAK